MEKRAYVQDRTLVPWRELVKGIASPLVAWVLLCAITLLLFVTGNGLDDWQLDLLLGTAAAVAIGTCALAARYWNRSRWRAVGMLVSLTLCAVGGLAIVLLLTGALARGLR